MPSASGEPGAAHVLMAADRPLKLLIVTDSAGNPRSFPASERVELEQTFPYLLRAQLPGAVVWQLSFGSLPTPKLLSQPMSYLTHWSPDVIVVQAGMADCNPILFTDFQREIIKRLTGRLYGRVMKAVNKPSLYRVRQTTAVTKTAFRRVLRQFKLVFPKSKIIWLGICADTASEARYPGLHRKMAEYNDIIEDVYKGDFVRMQQVMDEVQGLNSVDYMHWNTRGHRAAADLLMGRINAYLQGRESRA